MVSNRSRSIPRPSQEAKATQAGSAFWGLWTRLERHWGAVGVISKGDFEIKIKMDNGNADFLKSMLSPRREHRFWG